MKYQIIAILAVVLVVFAWPLARAKAQSAPMLEPAMLAQRIESREPLFLLDVRTPPELEEGVINGVVSVPLDQLANRVGEVEAAAKRPETTVVVICRSGVRAQRAAKFLTAAGIGRVVVLAGGMIAWRAAGLPIGQPAR